MNVAEMIDAEFGRQHPCSCDGDFLSRKRWDPNCVYHQVVPIGQDIVDLLIAYGHLPDDANDRSAGRTRDEIIALQTLREMVRNSE